MTGCDDESDTARATETGRDARGDRRSGAAPILLHEPLFEVLDGPLDATHARTQFPRQQKMNNGATGETGKRRCEEHFEHEGDGNDAWNAGPLQGCMPIQLVHTNPRSREDSPPPNHPTEGRLDMRVPSKEELAGVAAELLIERLLFRAHVLAERGAREAAQRKSRLKQKRSARRPIDQ